MYYGFFDGCSISMTQFFHEFFFLDFAGTTSATAGIFHYSSLLYTYIDSCIINSMKNNKEKKYFGKTTGKPCLGAAVDSCKYLLYIIYSFSKQIYSKIL